MKYALPILFVFSIAQAQNLDQAIATWRARAQSLDASFPDHPDLAAVLFETLIVGKVRAPIVIVHDTRDPYAATHFLRAYAEVTGRPTHGFDLQDYAKRSFDDSQLTEANFGRDLWAAVDTDAVAAIQLRKPMPEWLANQLDRVSRWSDIFIFQSLRSGEFEKLAGLKRAKLEERLVKAGYGESLLRGAYAILPYASTCGAHVKP